MHWRPGRGIQAQTPPYSWNGNKVNAGWVTTFNEFAVVSENRVTPVPASIDKKSAPLLGCAVTTALGVINNDAQVAIGESVVVFGVGGVGLNVVQFAAMVGANPVIAIDRLDTSPGTESFEGSFTLTATNLGEGVQSDGIALPHLALSTTYTWRLRASFHSKRTPIGTSACPPAS